MGRWFRGRNDMHPTVFDALLTHSPSLSHIYLPSPYEHRAFAVADVNTILGKHSHVTHNSVMDEGRSTTAYSSPHIQSLVVDMLPSSPYETSLNYLKQGVALAYVRLRSPDVSFKKVLRKRRFPNIKTLVWQRHPFDVGRTSKEEARYVPGKGDPCISHVFF